MSPRGRQSLRDAAERKARPLLADWWQSITDYCSHWNLKGNWDFIWREGPFFGGRKTTRKRTKHSCYKAWIQNTGFQEKGKGPLHIWFYLGLFLVSEGNILYLNLAKGHISFPSWLFCQICPPFPFWGMLPNTQGLWRATGPVWMDR